MIKDYFQTYWEIYKLEWQLFIDYWWVWLLIGGIFMLAAHFTGRRK